MTESAKRTTERNGVIAGVFQPSASRTEKSTSVSPSAKALGYSHSVRFADAENRLAAKPVLLIHPLTRIVLMRSSVRDRARLFAPQT